MHDTLDERVRPLLLQAGEAALALFRAARLSVQHKADGSPVTQADTLSEEILVRGLEAAFPGDAVVSEEGLGQGAGRRLWCVDPLDGTGSFVEGLAHWGPTLGLLEDGQARYGALYLPRTRDYFFAEQGEAWWNDVRLPSLAGDAGPSHRSILYIPSRLHAHVRLDWPGKARNLGSIAGHLAMVASGGAAAALIPGGWQRWDVACGLAMLEAVGGVAQVFDGAPLSLAAHGGLPFVAGTPSAARFLLAPGRLRLFPT